MVKITTLIGRHGNACIYCDGPMWLPDQMSAEQFGRYHGITLNAVHRRIASREHLHRRADGGPDHSRNLMPACGWCNQKRDRAPIEMHANRMRKMVLHGTHKGYEPHDWTVSPSPTATVGLPTKTQKQKPKPQPKSALDTLFR